jgi:hypothetical protein
MNDAASLAALSTVEEDHRLLLEKVRALHEAVSCLLERGESAARRALSRLRGLHEYFATHLASHVADEEAALFPYLERHSPGGPELVARLRREHDAITRRHEEFGNSLAVAGELEDGLPRAVLRDLLAYGWELWEVLDSHAGLETRAVHRCLTRCLGGDGGG